MDRAATTFREFVGDVEPALLRTAYLLTGRRGDAQAAVVAALAAVHRRWRRLDPAAAQAQARRALVAAVLTGQASAPQDVDEWDADLDADDVDRHVDADVPADDRAVLLALAALPVRTRAAVVLRLHDGLDEDAAADVLGEDPAVLAADVEAALDELVPLLRAEVPAEPEPVAPAPVVFDDGDPDAPFRRPRAPDPTADPYAAFRRPEVPAAPRPPDHRVPQRTRPGVPAPARDDDGYGLYRRPDAPVRERAAPSPAPDADPEADPDADPDAIYRRPR